MSSDEQGERKPTHTVVNDGRPLKAAAALSLSFSQEYRVILAASVVKQS